MVSIRRRRRHLGSAKSPVVEPPLPEGWTLSTDVNPDGEIVKCYTNVIGQKFYTMEDLLKYVEYAKREQLSIYTPGFHESQLVDTGSEDEGSDFLDSSEEETTRNDLKRASTANPPRASKPKKQTSGREQPKISNLIVATGAKLDDGATSSQKGKGIAKSSVSRSTPLRASRRLAGYEPEMAGYSHPERPENLKTKEDLITSGDQGEKLASMNESSPASI